MKEILIMKVDGARAAQLLELGYTAEEVAASVSVSIVNTDTTTTQQEVTHDYRGHAHNH